MRGRCDPRLLALVWLALLGVLSPAVGGQRQSAASAAAPPSQKEAQAVGAPLSPEHQRWLDSVAGLISDEERIFFLGLRRSYQREAFIEAFWQVRDPDPRTPVNELRRAFEQYRQTTGEPLTSDPRTLMRLLNGPPGGFSLPDGRSVSICYSRTREFEIWFYGGGGARVPRKFVVIFFKSTSQTPYKVWYPGQAVRPMQRSGLPTTDVRLLCAEELVDYATAVITQIPSYDRVIEQALTLPKPSSEWLASFAATLTDAPEGAETFDADLEVRFPGRNQSRTAVEVVFAVPRDQAPGRVIGDQLFHSFVLTGEVLDAEELFERFRYTFEGPTPTEEPAIRMGFTRYLRPGSWTLRLLLEDVLDNKYAEVVRTVEVPSPEGRPQVERTSLDALTARPRTIELLPPPGAVQSGLVRFNARTSKEVDRVAFFIDDRQVLSKGRPPYSVELDLGDTPQPHRVRAVAFVEGREIGSDQVWLNQGTARFSVKLIEPRSGGIYPGSVPVRVDISAPGGLAPEKVSLYQDDQLLTLLPPPYAGSVRLQDSAKPTVIRVVATLADGTAAEDAVVINTSGVQEEVQVSLVTVPVTVLDADGRPLAGLDASDFDLRVAGKRVAIHSVDATKDAPLQVALLVDRSISMRDNLPTVRDAVSLFAEQAIVGAEDRVALLSFSDQTSLDVGWTASQPELERGLAGLVAYGGTALFDGMIQAINALQDADRAGAVIVFTDGQDENSRSTPDAVRRLLESQPTTLFIVGLESGFPDRRARAQLEELAAISGGRVELVAGLDGLSAVYQRILDELRGRYLLTFEPQAAEQEGGDRPVPISVRVDRPGVEVRARAGYRPQLDR